MSQMGYADGGVLDQVRDAVVCIRSSYENGSPGKGFYRVMGKT